VAIFKYQAQDPGRAAVAGTIAADSPRQARDLLRARGLLVRSVDEHSAQAPTGRWWRRMLPSRSAHQWSSSALELSMLLRAGIPLLEALDTLALQHRGSFRAAIQQVRERVAAGSSLADAFRERPDVFDALSVNLIEVGESSGTLDQVLHELADFKQRVAQLKDRVFTALMYPVFLVVFGTATTVFLMTWVLPPLLENVQEQLQTLPWPTRVVKAASDVLVAHGWLVALGVAVPLLLAAVLLQTRRGKRLWHRFLLRLPLVGAMALKQNVSRIAMVIATLSRSGIVVTKALQLAARSTNNLVLREALEATGESVGAGRNVADALAASGAFPPLAVRIFSVGQETGRLEEMLDQLSADYDRQVATTSARLTALLEPILIICLAMFIGFVLLATILPILEAGNVF
jgi:type II secretory pathway component PulF